MMDNLLLILLVFLIVGVFLGLKIKRLIAVRHNNALMKQRMSQPFGQPPKKVEHPRHPMLQQFPAKVSKPTMSLAQMLATQPIHEPSEWWNRPQTANYKDLADWIASGRKNLHGRRAKRSIIHRLEKLANQRHLHFA